MKKCIKCGTEFEGNFCPKCGATATDELTCPKCGKKLKVGVNFCEWCGASFGSSAEPQKTSENKTKSSDFIGKLYGILKIVPVVAFSVFAVLLWLFYIAPVAVFPGIGESYGSAFTIMGEIPEFKGEMIALFILAALSLLCVVAIWTAKLLNRIKFKSVNAFGKRIKLSEVLEFSAFVLYFIFFLMGCIICGKVASFDGGMGMMAAGACPVLVLVFSIIFAIVGAGSLVGRYFIKKKFPEYSQGEEEVAIAQFEKYKGNIEEIVKAGAPVAPQTVDKPQAPLKAKKIMNSKIRAEFFAFVYVAVAAVVFTFALIIFDSIMYADEYSGQSGLANWYTNVYLLSGSAAFLVAMAIASACIRVKKVKSQRVMKKGFLIFTALLSICTIFAFSIYLAFMGINELPDSDVLQYLSEDYEIICCLAASGFIVLFGLISFIWSLAVISKIKKIQKNTEAYRELNEQLERYDKNKVDYAEYLKQCAEYKKQDKKYKHFVKVYASLNK